ncbi:MAG TPA: DUF493 family protein [Kiritimatiellia bacterium]|nr:DUF493 family protein [Kiritimatiellia bacterium]HRU71057.1 DUF493 family protein [Kiritimatiellia bacterium]
MSIRVNHDEQRGPVGQQVEYPATFHFRVSAEASACSEPHIAAVLTAYQVVESLSASRASSLGRYHAFSVSVLLQTQEELHALDAALKRVPGVRMVL